MVHMFVKRAPRHCQAMLSTGSNDIMSCIGPEGEHDLVPVACSDDLEWQCQEAAVSLMKTLSLSTMSEDSTWTVRNVEHLEYDLFLISLAEQKKGRDEEGGMKDEMFGSSMQR